RVPGGASQTAPAGTKLAADQGIGNPRQHQRRNRLGIEKDDDIARGRAGPYASHAVDFPQSGGKQLSELGGALQATNPEAYSPATCVPYADYLPGKAFPAPGNWIVPGHRSGSRTSQMERRYSSAREAVGHLPQLGAAWGLASWPVLSWPLPPMRCSCSISARTSATISPACSLSSASAVRP